MMGAVSYPHSPGMIQSPGMMQSPGVLSPQMRIHSPPGMGYAPQSPMMPIQAVMGSPSIRPMGTTMMGPAPIMQGQMVPVQQQFQYMAQPPVPQKIQNYAEMPAFSAEQVYSQPLFQKEQRAKLQRSAPAPPPPQAQGVASDYKYKYAGRYELKPRDSDRIATPSSGSSRAPTGTPRVHNDRYQSMGHDHSIVERAGNARASHSGDVNWRASMRDASPQRDRVHNDIQYPRSGIRDVSPARGRTNHFDANYKVYVRPRNETAHRSYYSNYATDNSFSQYLSSYDRPFASLYHNDQGRSGRGSTSQNGSCVQQ